MTLAPEHAITKSDDANRAASERSSMRLAAGLLIAGEVTFLLAGLFHPSHADANHHQAVFKEYAASHNWGLVHLGQFVGIAIFVAGLLALIRALDLDKSPRAWLARAAAISAVIGLGLYAVLQAVDGVALKHSVDAWVNATPSAKPAAFASAQSMRWFEWGVRSYQQLMQGLSLVLFGIVLASTERFRRSLSYLATLAGIALMAQGLTIGAEGFSGLAGLIGLFALALPLVWTIGVAIAAARP